VRLLQIWLLPERGGLTPSYEQKSFGKEDKHNRLRLIVSHDGREGSVGIHQDVSVYAAALDPGIAVAHALPRGRHAWVQVVHGRLRAGDGEIKTGDGVAISGEERIALHAEEASEVLLFDLA
jgi:redox-sensitive bicupin YhaK (pirin superfamily)